MASLYELSEQILNFKFNIDEETGEVLNINELDEINMAFNDKAENIIKYIKNLESEAEALRNEEKAFADRRKAKENKIESLKYYLKRIMESNQREKLEFTSGVASFRKSKVVETEDQFIKWAKENGNEYLTYKDPTISKSAIKLAIESGVEIPFARLVENKNLNIK